MKRAPWIVGGLLVAGGLAVLVFGPFRDAPQAAPDPAGMERAGAAPSPVVSGDGAPGAGRPAARSPRKPVPEGLDDPRALDPEPLPLTWSDPVFERQEDGRIFKKDVIAMAAELNGAGHEALEDVQMLGALVDSYRTIFRANPIAGENREVVEALTGKNAYRLVLLDPAHPAINAAGELVDRWETPFRFHALSGARMEIVSAGEDRQFGTADDVMTDEPIVIGNRRPAPDRPQDVRR